MFDMVWFHIAAFLMLERLESEKSTYNGIFIQECDCVMSEQEQSCVEFDG